MNPILFSPIRLRDVELKNRIAVSPMCQYSATGGIPGPWHLVHLGSRAVGGAALVLSEATSVSAEGRISPADTGIWSEAHAEAWRPITTFLREQGGVPGIQIAHAGRKASTDAPWRGGQPLAPGDGGWTPIAPSAVPFSTGHPMPRAMAAEDFPRVLSEFEEAARFSRAAGFDVVEIHMAHGYLLHQFLSPIANRRDDDYGGSLENRMRFPLEVAEAVRRAWPETLPVLVRLSATDWVEGGWDLAQSRVLARALKTLGIDLVDCSSGGMVADARIPAGPGFQVPFSADLRREAGIATGAVGLITDPAQAEQIVATGQADIVMMARELLRDPYWPLHAAQRLGAEIPVPPQYQRSRPRA
jgi:2,4-dienoyl-CoA reductase-like NADH-dependent reductase (Old Yellow Enzyme family)